MGLVWAPLTPRHFARQAWHNLTSTVVLPGRRGTHGSGLGALDAAAFCVAGVAQPHIHVGFASQVWHKLTSTVVLRGRRGTHSHLLSFCLAGAAQPHIHVRFAWQEWHKLTSTVVLRGSRGTHGTGWRAWSGLGARDAATFCVAGVAQTHIYRRFAWQAWYGWHWVARLVLV